MLLTSLVRWISSFPKMNEPFRMLEVDSCEMLSTWSNFEFLGPLLMQWWENWEIHGLVLASVGVTTMLDVANPNGTQNDTHTILILKLILYSYWRDGRVWNLWKRLELKVT